MTFFVFQIRFSSVFSKLVSKNKNIKKTEINMAQDLTRNAKIELSNKKNENKQMNWKMDGNVGSWVLLVFSFRWEL